MLDFLLYQFIAKQRFAGFRPTDVTMSSMIESSGESAMTRSREYALGCQ